MAHDEWRAQLRIHSSDPATLASLLADLPVDGLQHAGNAIVSYAREPGIRPIVQRLISALTE